MIVNDLKTGELLHSEVVEEMMEGTAPKFWAPYDTTIVGSNCLVSEAPDHRFLCFQSAETS